MSETYEEQYWKDRRSMESKHMLQVISWAEFFQPTSVFDFGCGTGEYLHVWEDLGVKIRGYDVSEYACKHAYGRARGSCFPVLEAPEKHDLVTCYDVMEHLTEAQVDEMLLRIKERASKWILFSICMAGDPNYMYDPTHVLQRSRKWWGEKLAKHFDVYDAPPGFLYAQQLLMCQVRDEK